MFVPDVTRKSNPKNVDYGKGAQKENEDDKEEE